VDDSSRILYLIIGGLLLFYFFSVKFISYLKRRKNNIPLWSSIFVGITMGLVNLDIHIEPSTQIERKAKRNGKHELPDDFIDPTSIKISKNG